MGAKTRPQTGALRVVEQPELPLRSIKQREAAGAAVSTLRSQRTAPSLQGPVSPITGTFTKRVLSFKVPVLVLQGKS